MTEIKLFPSCPEELAAEAEALRASAGLRAEQPADETALALRDGRVIGAGSRRGDVLERVAVSPEAEGEGVAEALVGRLTESALAAGRGHLFLCARPAMAGRFISLGFTPLAETGRMSLLENSSTALRDWLAGLERGAGGRTGAIVANLDPLTRGHLYLLETAAGACDTVHLFVLGGEASFFPAAERLEMARRAAARFPNVLVHPGGRYIVSAATYPAYFLKDASEAADAQQELDAALFARRIAPALGISVRFVGTEPFCAGTRGYNGWLKRVLPRCGVELREIERLDGISASRVRALMKARDMDAIRALVPEESCEFILRRLG